MQLVRAGLPLYRQLASVIRAMATDDTEAPLTEQRLCDQFGVSRTTVRQALQELAAEGRVVRLQGKGTTVVPRKRGHGHALWVFGTIEDMITYGHETAYVLEEHGPTTARRDVADVLHVSSDARLYRFLGVRSAGAGPFALIETWLPYQIGVQVVPHLNGNSPITALVEDKLGIHVAAVEQTFSAAPARGAVARRIGIRTGQSLLVITRVYFDGSDVPVALSTNYCNVQRFVYRVRLQRRGGS